tara:strand:- start:2441 stop:3307 length:867 start_codon:yes stop_codon:yes gene_type:complete
MKDIYDLEFKDFSDNMEREATESTLKLYKSQYNTIRSNFDKPLKKVPNKELIKWVMGATTKAGKEMTINSKKNLLNVMVMVKKQVSHKEYKELYEMREELRADVDSDMKNKHQKMSMNDVPEYNELVKYLATQSNAGYIINYLLLYYCVRNRDLDLVISEYKNEIPDTGNHLLIDGDKIIFVRNDYKTVKTHGQLVYEISAKLFVKTVKKLYEAGEEKLLKTKAPDKEIRTHTYKNLSETEICKVVVHHFLMGNRYSDVFEISKRRGTSVETLMMNYNYKYINAETRE